MGDYYELYYADLNDITIKINRARVSYNQMITDEIWTLRRKIWKINHEMNTLLGKGLKKTKEYKKLRQEKSKINKEILKKFDKYIY